MAFALGFLFTFVVPVFALVVIVRGLTFPAPLNRSARPVCGACRHEVGERRAGAADDRVCPECGVSYDTAGVLTRALSMRHRPGTLAVVICVTFIAVLGAAWVSFVLPPLVAGGASLTRTQRDMHITANRRDGFRPTGAPGYKILLDTTVEASGSGPAQSGVITLTITEDRGGSAIVLVDLPSRAWRTSGLSGGVFDADAALRVLGAAGVDTDPAYARREAGQLADAIEAINRSPDAAFGGRVPMFNRPAVVTPPPVNVWQPGALQRSGSSSSASAGDATNSFEFEGRTGITGASGFEGEITFRSTGATLNGVTLRVRDAERGSVVMDYDPASGDAEIVGPAQGRVATFADHEAAVRACFGEVGLGRGPSGAQEIDDLADLIATMEANPRHFESPSVVTPAPVAPAADGEPDGGLDSFGGGGSSSPVTGLRGVSPVLPAAYGVIALVYAAAVTAVLVRRRRMRTLAAPKTS